VAVLLAACGPAGAFYWHGWPGSRVTAVPTLIPPPSHTTPPGTPTPPTPVPVPPDGPPVTPPTPPIVPPPVGPPNQTPEPSTGLIALAGLGAIAARRWWKKS
jgi:MYXO-CTERM domain-containing protein